MSSCSSKNKSQTSQRVIKNTLFLYIRMGVSILVNIFTTRILLEALGVSDFGLYNVVGGSIAMLGFVSASMSTATQRFLSYAEGEGHIEKIVKIFNNAIIIHRGLALLTVLILAVAGIFLFNGILNIPIDRLSVAIAIYICMLISTVYSITIVPYDAALNAHENMLYYSILGIGDVCFKLIIAIAILFIESDKLLFYAILMAIESWLLRIITQFYCKRRYNECKKVDIRKHFDKSIIKKMTNFAGWNMTNTATSMISLFGMNIVINHYFGTEVNAAMGIATQLSGIMMGVSLNMIKALTPILVKKEGGHQREQMLEITYVGCKFSYLLFSFICIPIVFQLPFILKLWLREVPDWTTVFCLILIIGTLIDQLTVFLYQAISAEGHIRNYNIVRSFVNILPIISSIILFAIWEGSPYWAILNWCIAKSLFGGFVNLYYAMKNVKIKLSMYLKEVIIPCLLITIFTSSIGFTIITWIHSVECAMNLLSIVCMIIIAIPLYWAIGLNTRERGILTQIALNILHK